MPSPHKLPRSPLTGVLFILSKLPLGALQWLASLYSGLIGRINSARARHTVERNLLIAFPELSQQQRQALSSRTLQAQFQSMLEFVKCWGNPPAWSIAQIKQVEGQHLLEEALNQRKGLILVLSHFGSWEISNAWVSQFTDLVIMYKPSSNQPLEQLVLKARSSLGTTLVPTDKSGVRQMLAALKQGRVTALLPDHSPEESGGIYSDFFGCPVLTGTLVSRLAHKTQCAVLQMSCMRLPDLSGFSILFEPMDRRIAGADLQASVDTLNRSFEQIIRRYPQHYHWNYKRFKANPLLENIYYVPDDQVAAQILKAQQHRQSTQKNSST